MMPPRATDMHIEPIAPHIRKSVQSISGSDDVIMRRASAQIGTRYRGVATESSYPVMAHETVHYDQLRPPATFKVLNCIVKHSRVFTCRKYSLWKQGIWREGPSECHDVIKRAHVSRKQRATASRAH